VNKPPVVAEGTCARLDEQGVAAPGHRVDAVSLLMATITVHRPFQALTCARERPKEAACTPLVKVVQRHELLAAVPHLRRH